jgi:ABC-type sugar transport system substrate-binding protein
MAKQLLRFCCLLTLLLSATILVSAQDEAKPAHKSVTVTGCVHKGTEPGGFYLQGENGKTWELTDAAEKVGDHVGHKVAVTGYSMHEPKAEESKMAASEKEEAAGTNYADFHVSSVKMVSDSCEK